MYCHTDVLNYDNYDFIDHPTTGNTYYCVAWNVHTTPPTDVCPNIPGNQATVPEGKHLVDGQCVDIPVTPPGPTCTLSISAHAIDPSHPVVISWTSSNATTGSIDHNVGNATPVGSGSTPSDTIFPSSDTTYTGTFGNGTATTTCTTSVTINGGGGGCNGNSCGGGGGGGGGPNQPTVTLLGTPGAQPLAFVSLAAVPYTGFEAGPMLTLAFWLAVGLWSAGIAYMLMGKRGMRLIAERVFAFAPSVVEYDEGAYAENAPIDASGAPHEAISPIMESTMAMPMTPAVSVMPMPAAPSVARASEGIPDLADVIETRAHAAGVLLSPEALSMAMNLSTDRAETLRVFGDILNDAVKSVPREDGWILLSSDRFTDIAQKFSTASAPVTVVEPAYAPTISREAVSVPQPRAGQPSLAEAIIAYDRDAAFAIVRTAEKDGADAVSFMTAAAALLDKRYRENPSDRRLHDLVELFAQSLDATYANPYTGVKLAIARAFEVK
jgi:hypothetical protein